MTQNKDDDFKKLQEIWYKKAKDSGFVDIEPNGILKQHDTRTIAFENRDRIQYFFRALDHYIETSDIIGTDRRILILYSLGYHICNICDITKLKRYYVNKIIKKHKANVLKQMENDNE